MECMLRLNICKIREIAGHEDEKTTLNSYCFDRHKEPETEEILENEGEKCNLLSSLKLIRIKQFRHCDY